MNDWWWVLVAFVGGWSLIALILWTFTHLTHNLLKRRYKPENDRGRPIAENENGKRPFEERNNFSSTGNRVEQLEGRQHLSSEIADSLGLNSPKPIATSNPRASSNSIEPSTSTPSKPLSFTQRRWGR